MTARSPALPKLQAERKGGASGHPGMIQKDAAGKVVELLASELPCPQVGVKL